jgi:tetratricopeptide (TPR) repeat protein
MNRPLAACAFLFTLSSVACGGDMPPQSPSRPSGPSGAASADPDLALLADGQNGPNGKRPAGAKPGAGAQGGASAAAGDEYARGSAAFKAGDYPTARASFEASVKKNPKQADAHYALALVLDKTGDRAAAEKSYKDALGLQPDMLEAAENLAALYVESGRYDDAASVAKKALEKNAKSAPLTLNYAVALGGKGDQAGSQKAFEDALRLEPNNALFHITYAQQLASWKKRDEALDRLKLAQKAAGDDPALLGGIGFELRTLRAAPECVQVFDKAIALKDNADFRTNRALCKHANKDKTGAIADLVQATTKEPEFAPARYWLGWAQHEEGKFTEAAAAYKKYLELAPKGPLAKAAEAKLALARDKKKSPPPPKR